MISQSSIAMPEMANVRVCVYMWVCVSYCHIFNTIVLQCRNWPTSPTLYFSLTFLESVRYEAVHSSSLFTSNHCFHVTTSECIACENIYRFRSKNLGLGPSDDSEKISRAHRVQHAPASFLHLKFEMKSNRSCSVCIFKMPLGHSEYFLENPAFVCVVVTHSPAVFTCRGPLALSCVGNFKQGRKTFCLPQQFTMTHSL